MAVNLSAMQLHQPDLHVTVKAIPDFLRAHGCNKIQGYFFSRPLPADAFAGMLCSGTALTGAGAALA